MIADFTQVFALQRSLLKQIMLVGDSVSIELSNKAEEAGTATFTPAEYLLGVVQQIVKSRAEMMVSLPGKGELLISPERKAYFSNFPDLAAYCQIPSGLFESTSWSGAVPPSFSGPKPLSELLWQTAFHASQGRLVEGSSRYDVAQFRHWPNLTRLPVTPNSARICALLTRHPSTIMLVHRVLGIGREEVYQNYSAAFCAGIVNVKSSSPDAAKVEDSALDKAPEPTHERSGLFRSLFAKISGL